MTPKSAQRLAALVNDGDFISDLINHRPSLSGLNNEEIIANAKKAEGWEDCVKYIISMVAIEPNPGKTSYVDTRPLG